MPYLAGRVVRELVSGTRSRIMSSFDRSRPLAQTVDAAAPIRDVEAELFTDEKLGLTVLGGTTALVQAYVSAVPANVPQRNWRGEDPNTSSRRARLAQVRQRVTEDGGVAYSIRSYGDLYGRYADAHGGKGPNSLEDLMPAAPAPPAEDPKDEKPENSEKAKRRR